MSLLHIWLSVAHWIKMQDAWACLDLICLLFFLLFEVTLVFVPWKPNFPKISVDLDFMEFAELISMIYYINVISTFFSLL